MAEETKNQFLDKAGLQTLWRKIGENFDQLYVYEPYVGEEGITSDEAMAMLNALSSAHEQNQIVLVATESGFVPATRVDYDGEGTAVIEYINPTDRNELVRYTHNSATFTKETVDLLQQGEVLTQTMPFDLEFVPAGSEAGVSVPTIFLKVNGERKGLGIDATPFIVDGMLDDTDVLTVTEADTDLIAKGYEIGSKLIKFIWKGVTDASGNPKADYIRVSDIAVEPETENTVVSDNIIIAGGPLADIVKSVFTEKDADGNLIVPKDLTLQEFLTRLLTKEMWPTSISTSDATLVSTVVAPTITMNTTTVEVGTSVAFSAANGKSGYTATPHKASGFTYGWADDNDNVKDGSETSKSAAFGTVSVKSDTSTLTVVTPKETLTETGTSAAGSAVVDGTIVAAEGSNTVKATGTSATYEGTCGALPVYYGCSNTGKTSESYKSTAKSEVTKTSTVKTSTQATKSFTAQYKWFMGCSDATLPSEMDSAKVRALSKNGWITVDNTTTIISASSSWESDGRTIIIACPEKYKLATVTDGFGVDHKPVFSDRTKVSVATGTVNTTYKVYMLVTGTKMTLKNITLAKAANTDEF